MVEAAPDTQVVLDARLRTCGCADKKRDSFQLRWRNRHSTDELQPYCRRRIWKISWNLSKPTDNSWHSSENHAALSSTVKVIKRKKEKERRRGDVPRGINFAILTSIRWHVSINILRYCALIKRFHRAAPNGRVENTRREEVPLPRKNVGFQTKKERKKNRLKV